jgi:hypothetical protein
LLVSLFLRSQAQIQVLFPVITSPLLTKQLDDLTVMNQGLEVEIKADVLISIAGTPFVRFVSEPVRLLQNQSIRFSELRTGLDHLYFSNELSDKWQVYELLSFRTLEVCVSIRTSDELVILNRECQEYMHEVSCSIMQITPPDNAVLENPQPVFTWSGLGLEPASSYELVIVESLPGQTREEAIHFNPPLVQVALVEALYAYSDFNLPMEKDHQYYWQVKGRCTDGSVMWSEVWNYSLSDPGSLTQSKTYRKLLQDVNSGNYVYDHSVCFAFDNRGRDGQLNYRVVSSSTGKQIDRLPQILVKNGYNKVDIDLDRVPGIVKGEEYELTVVDQDMQHYTLRFKGI